MSTPTRRFLFTMWEGGGTLPPQLGVARRLIGRGHQVHVVADPTVAERAEAIGCGFTPWRRAPHRTSLDPAEDLFRDWEVGNPLAMLRNFRDLFMAGPAAEFAAETVEAIDLFGPDEVVADSMMLGTIIGAQAAGLPVAVLMPNVWMIPTPGVPAVGVPMVCIPMGRDQNDTAARVVHHGAGKRLSPKAGADKIARAVREVLDDDRYRAGAGRLAAAIAHEGESADVAAELEALAAAPRAQPC